MKSVFLSKNGLLVVNNGNGVGVFTNNEGYALRVADPKETQFLSGVLPQIEVKGGLKLSGQESLEWHYVATLPGESDQLIFARKRGRRIEFISVLEDQSGGNDRQVAVLKLYGVEGHHEVVVWTGPSRFDGYADGDFIAVDEVSRSLEIEISVDWFAQFGRETKLEAFKNLKKVLGRKPGMDEILSRPMRRGGRRRK